MAALFSVPAKPRILSSGGCRAAADLYGSNSYHRGTGRPERATAGTKSDHQDRSSSVPRSVCQPADQGTTQEPTAAREPLPCRLPETTTGAK
jgi:hypothetical protein